MAEKLSDYKFKTDITIRFSDIDAVGHVNNAVYLTYFELARIGYWRDVTHWNLKDNGIVVGRSEINYLKPVTIDDKLICYVRVIRIGNSSFDVEYILVKKVHGKEEICTKGLTSCVTYDYNLNKSTPIPSYQKNKMRDFEALSVRSPEFQV